MAKRHAAVLTGQLLRLGKQFADGDRPLRPGFEDPVADRAEGQVLRVSPIDEAVEFRILKDLPPVLEMAILDGGIVGVDPRTGQRRAGLVVVGPYFEAVRASTRPARSCIRCTRARPPR